jgi:hypothetical protein
MRRQPAGSTGSATLFTDGAPYQAAVRAIDEAIAKKADIDNFLNQEIDERSSIVETCQVMSEISGMKIPAEEMQSYQKGEDFFIPDDSYEDAVDETEMYDDESGNDTERDG